MGRIFSDNDNDTYYVCCPKCKDFGKLSMETDRINFKCNNCGFSIDDNYFSLKHKLLNAEQFDILIGVFDMLDKTHSSYFYNVRMYDLSYGIGNGLIKQGKDFNTAKQYIQRSLSFYEGAKKELHNNINKWYSLYAMYQIHRQLGEISDARRYIFEAYSDVNDENVKITIGENNTISSHGNEFFAKDYFYKEFLSIDNEYADVFIEKPCYNRKVLLITKKYVGLRQEHFEVLSINSNLSKLSFPIGHPKANEVYVAHPLITNRYMPIENYQLELIEEQVREFCVLAQSLGATEINIRCLNDNSNNATNSGNKNLAGGVSIGQTNIHGSSYNEYSHRLIEEMSRSISLHQTFQPQSPPELPNNLVWYAEKASWQQLFRQRLDGILTHEERIETKKSQVVDNHEMNKIKGELKSLFADMDVAFDKTEEAKFEQQENAVLAISVKFAPLSQLTGNATSTPNDKMFSANEQKYIDEVKECLADGEITKTGRRLLNMHRERLGISENRAAELEASVTTHQLTDNEKEYLEAYQEANENGQISDKERRILNHIRGMLGITEEKARQIEKQHK